MARVTSGLPGAGFEGRFANAVFYQGADGAHIIPRITTANPRTPSQTQSRTAFAAATQGWRGLTDTQIGMWEDYARPLGRTAYHVYVSLTRKWMRVNPPGPAPATPPTNAFFGDACRLRTGVVAADGSPSPAPSSPGTRHPRKEGSSSGLLTVTSDRSNSTRITTEILVQPVANARRKPKARGWRTAAFYAFTVTAKTASVPLPPGAYAVGYRFVDTTTGQQTDMALLSAVVVG